MPKIITIRLPMLSGPTTQKPMGNSLHLKNWPIFVIAL